jgi:hypothetical protein
MTNMETNTGVDATAAADGVEVENGLTVEKTVNTKKGTNPGHGQYTVFLVLLSGIIIAALILSGAAGGANIAATVSAQICACTVFMAAIFSTTYFFLGVKVNVYDEIVIHRNLPLSLLVSSMVIGFAIVISKAAL